MRKTATARSRSVSRFKRIPLKGDRVRGNGLDDGKYVRCANCGYICDLDRDSLAQTANSVGATDFVPNTYPTGNTPSVLGGVGKVFVSHELTADGSIVKQRYSQVPVIQGGCPFCGTQNYDGSQGE